jgi:hypothetical protein
MGCVYIAAVLIGIMVAITIALIIVTIYVRRTFTLANIQCSINNAFVQEYNTLRMSSNRVERSLACVITNFFDKAGVPIQAQSCAVDIGLPTL